MTAEISGVRPLQARHPCRAGHAQGLLRDLGLSTVAEAKRLVRGRPATSVGASSSSG